MSAVVEESYTSNSMDDNESVQSEPINSLDEDLDTYKFLIRTVQASAIRTLRST